MYDIEVLLKARKAEDSLCPNQTQVADYNWVFPKFLKRKISHLHPERSRYISCKLCPETIMQSLPVSCNPPSYWLLISTRETIVTFLSRWSEPQGFSCYPQGGCCLAFTTMSSSLSSPLHLGSNWKGIHNSTLDCHFKTVCETPN